MRAQTYGREPFRPRHRCGRYPARSQPKAEPPNTAPFVEIGAVPLSLIAMPRRLNRRWAVVSLYVAVILAVTLTPGSTPLEWSSCLICGERAVADAIANLLLFVPLGAAVAGAAASRPRLAYLLPFLLSLLIEFAQIFLTGRDSSVGDVAFNTVGAGVGALLFHRLTFWTLSTNRLGGALVIASAFGLTGIVALTGALFQPDLPITQYHGQWTPFLGHLAWYRGQVLAARIGSIDAPSSPLPRDSGIYAALQRGDSVQIRAVAGPPVPRLASLFGVADDRQRGILLIGPRGEDLVVRYRMRAAAARLDQPDLRVHGAMEGIVPGDTFDVIYWRTADGSCVAVNRRAPTCGLGYTPGRGWALLLYHESLPDWLRRTLDLSWLFALAFPVGYWLSLRWESAAATVLVGFALLALPGLVGLQRASLAECASALVALSVGHVLARLHNGKRGRGRTPAARNETFP